MRKVFTIIACAIMFFPSFSIGQRTCATMERDAALRADHPELGTHAEFESWMRSKLLERAQNGTSRSGAVKTIPVVFHIIYDAADENISDAQVMSQLEILNEDFRRTNADTTNTPADFLPVAADTEYEFCMAQIDPDGNPTNGINRVNWTAQGSPYGSNYVDNNIKPATSWDPDNYFNIWVANLSGGLLGWAQFPNASGLPGMDPNNGVGNTDGVVLLHSSVGRPPANPFPGPYNLGRTATHEVGHCFGLRHIWGDGPCGDDDFCDDTPTAGSANFSCDAGLNSCTDTPVDYNDMVQNYMDYTNDDCMNLFTFDQKDRIDVVFENSPWRASLLNSTVCQPPIPPDLDVALSDILSPSGTLCETEFSAEVEITNLGMLTLTTCNIWYSLDGASPTAYAWTGSLANGASTTVTLPALTALAGAHTLDIYTSDPNGGLDENTTNDAAATTFETIDPLNGAAYPLAEGFEGTTFTPGNWTLDNPDGGITWERVSPQAFTGTGSMGINNYQYSTGIGQTDDFISELIDNSGISPANPIYVYFDVAYRQYFDENDNPDFRPADTLQIWLANECEDDWHLVYSKGGEDLATGPTIVPMFVPSSSSDWRNDNADLTPFLTGNSFRLKFRNVSDWGNNIYIDNINITPPPQFDAALTAIAEPVGTICQNAITPNVTLVNNGTAVLTSCVFSYSIDGGSPMVFNWTGGLATSQSTSVSLTPVTTLPGTHNIVIYISNPNGNPDQYLLNDTLEQDFLVIDPNNGMPTPFTEGFESSTFPPNLWELDNPDESTTWFLVDYTASEGSQCSRVFNFGYNAPGEQDALLTPTISSNGIFSNVSMMLYFDIAYAKYFNTNDPGFTPEETFEVLVSNGCSNNWLVAYSKTGDSLATFPEIDSSFIPVQASSEWRTEQVDLTNFITGSTFRVMFRQTNDYGNNVYLDNINIDLMVGIDGKELETSVLVYPNPSKDVFNVQFDLTQKRTVDMKLFNSLGIQVGTYSATGVQNESVGVDLSDKPSGIYYLELHSGDTKVVKKLVKMN